MTSNVRYSARLPDGIPVLFVQPPPLPHPMSGRLSAELRMVMHFVDNIAPILYPTGTKATIGGIIVRYDFVTVMSFGSFS